MVFRMSKSKHGFTLIELLVVIAIIAILSVVVLLTLNPTELLRSSRDSNRVADMQTLTTALGIFSEDQSSGSLGSANTVYVSIPDPTATSTLGDQCQGLGLPALPSAYSYHCAASSTYRNINGTGWIPVNFSSISLGSPLGSLPIDPLNTSSTRNYYTYSTNGTQYEVTSAMESQKYKLGGSNDVVGPDGSTLSTVYAKGSNVSIEPLDYGDTSLVGYWSFNEGTGSSTYDYSGNGNTGTWNGTPTGTNGYYSPGKVGPWAGTFDGTSTWVSTSNSGVLGITARTIYIWFQTTSQSLSSSSNDSAMVGYGTNACGSDVVIATNDKYGGGTNYNGISADFYCGAITFSAPNMYNGLWHNAVVVVPAGSTVGNVLVYFDGSLVTSTVASTGLSQTINTGSSNKLGIGGWNNNNEHFNGLIDDVRIYNRALSAGEIAAMYAGGK